MMQSNHMGVKAKPGGQSRYTLRCHLIAASASHLAFAAPSLFLLVALSVIDLGLALFLFLFFFLASPLAGAITWLIDKGSRGENGLAAVKALGAMPGRFYGLLLGGLLGNHVGGSIGGIVGAILLYFAGRSLGFRLGSSISLRLANYFS
jgi:hypothetical protein